MMNEKDQLDFFVPFLFIVLNIMRDDFIELLRLAGIASWFGTYNLVVLPCTLPCYLIVEEYSAIAELK